MTGVSIRMLGVLRARDKSFSRAVMASTFTLVLVSTRVLICLPFSSSLGLPSESVTLTCFCLRIHPGTRPYMVTVGPGWASSTSTSTP